MAVDLAVSVPTVVGSLLSALASAFVLVIFAASPKSHFRHWLILNLTIADFLNATNNTVSGFLVVSRHHDLNPGPGCQLNGWIGQLSVQAIDFSILAIAIVALWLVQRPTIVSTLSWRAKSRWFRAHHLLLAGTTALCLGIVGPVSGNWCWIESQYLGLRYALGHGWRIAIVFITAVTYIVVFVVVKRRYAHLSLFPNGDTSSGRDKSRSTEGDPVDLSSIRLDTTITVQSSEVFNTQANTGGVRDSPSRDYLSSQFPISAVKSLPSKDNTTSNERRLRYADTLGTRGDPTERRDKTIRYVEVRRVMLLNGYPAFYVLLWIPGLLNRLLESLGHQMRWLQILQASTQFIGLANAFTYSYNEGFRRQIRSLITRQRQSHHEQL
ncbi:G protein-coupled glucose receptor regulating Gpa2-domain-containing protein [Aspergillus avenaceus]|uniref:G protein-coupled glucose receptor regulating Gpa2-domain-containing protein n=1 Tax=Aspergillus avenaceus TaxID=36643 RepID=A0A5N6U3M4_ASPAV|nr:G protein-coupled glucose receptor regulating Gpa2-domain-containing protein [Aspergillus avenaceus]